MRTILVILEKVMRTNLYKFFINKKKRVGMIKAVFFDMDGTIADSEKIVWKVTRDFMQKRNIIVTHEEEKLLYGLIWKESIRRILEIWFFQIQVHPRDSAGGHPIPVSICSLTSVRE